ncbi:hypothetical protein SNE25_08100 [Mucilaginibacter sabulilitoris]|uniref:Outer membrane protein beta-barrel domain-containing protein n=1 Tax=Mucilaginibacter sabulilitoris TaxID=1173583 RepID=A0ABZ0TTJ3_9SPHI|nr:outer membrane beta-barrel protein [Mucilaginibacter sabulilitoris]WPU95483.1 hypothetical protein SNE25_08100 [Mucilaginibacter sabulilitoris]
MKKLLLVLAIVGGTAFSSFAQSSGPADAPKFSVGVEAGLPIGNIKNGYNFVIGGSLKYELPIAESTMFTISAGYNSFLAKSEFKDIGGESAGFIPVKAGIKYYLNQGFFAEGQLGAAFGTKSGEGTAFAYSPGIGYTFDGGFEAGVRYEGWSHDGTVSQIGLRLAYRF